MLAGMAAQDAMAVVLMYALGLRINWAAWKELARGLFRE
jgi:hypothetical protein